MRRTVLAVLLACAASAGCSGHGQTATAAHPRPVAASPSASTDPAALRRVPAGFEAVSATFVSDRHGWVLGTVPCDSDSDGDGCGLVARTTDGGVTWQALARVRAGRDGALRFADARNGFLLDDGLLATHDGGRTWRPVDTRRDALDEPWSAEAAAGVLWLTGRTGETGRGLWLGSVRASSFDLAPVVLPDGDEDVWLSLHGRGVVLAYRDEGVPRVLVSQDGDRFASSALPCAPTGPLALRTTRAFLLACGTSIRTSRDAGRSWHELAPAPAGGVPLATPRSLFVVGDDGLYASRDEGGTWTQVVDARLRTAGFESARLGFVIDHRGGMRLTHDDGRSWERVDFRRT